MAGQITKFARRRRHRPARSHRRNRPERSQSSSKPPTRASAARSGNRIGLVQIALTLAAAGRKSSVLDARSRHCGISARARAIIAAYACCRLPDPSATLRFTGYRRLPTLQSIPATSPAAQASDAADPDSGSDARPLLHSVRRTSVDSFISGMRERSSVSTCPGQADLDWDFPRARADTSEHIHPASSLTGFAERGRVQRARWPWRRHRRRGNHPRRRQSAGRTGYCLRVRRCAVAGRRSEDTGLEAEIARRSELLWLRIMGSAIFRNSSSAAGR